MTFFEEALRSLAAAVRVIRHDASAFDDFNVTVDGFWRSFGAFLFLVPLAYPVFLSGNAYDAALAAAEGSPPPALDLFADYVYLALQFALWPVIVVPLARLFALSANYLRYMIAYNWISVPANGLFVLPVLPWLAGWTDPQTTMVGFTLMGFVLIYLSWYVARHGLRTSGAIAAAIVAAEYVFVFGLAHVLPG